MSVRFEILTLFPELLESALRGSVLGRAEESGQLEFVLRQIRNYAEGRHRICDDTPYGGGAGMVMKPEPVVAAIESARSESPCPEEMQVFLMGPSGRRFNQGVAAELSLCPHLVLVCGRYEGIDDRVRDYVDGELSLGDFVLSGGEPAAYAMVDAVARLVPGVLGNAESTRFESFQDGLLEYPQFTRPPVFRGVEVPAVLRSGDHAKIDAWRQAQAEGRTGRQRPDLLRERRGAGAASGQIERPRQEERSAGESVLSQGQTPPQAIRLEKRDLKEAAAELQLGREEGEAEGNGSQNT